MPPGGTLLASAVEHQQARFVTDVGRYMQVYARPAPDMFTRSADVVSSIVVVPILRAAGGPSGAPPAPGGGGAGGALGALYWAFETRCDFQHLQETLLGFIQSVSPLLHYRLAHRAEGLAALAEQQPQAASPAAPRPAPPGGSGSTLASLTDAPPRGAGSARDSSSAAPSTGGAGASWRSSSLSAGSGASARAARGQGRLNTEAVLQLMQADIRRRARAGGAGGDGARGAAEVAVGRVLGRGGFGVVHKGVWHRQTVAVKILPARGSDRDALQGAAEMAVLSSVQHPNIVSVYSCFTDMVEAPADGASPGPACGGGKPMVTYRRLQPGEEDAAGARAVNLVVMELCDRGTLRDGVKAGLLHRPLEGGAIGVNLAAAVEVLLDVAYAVQYVHSLGLVHGDIKLDNVLVKSDRSKRLGFVCKLGDFGLARILSEGDDRSCGRAAAAGTASHLAPEMFAAGAKITTAVDTYAFGILLWELYTGSPAYGHLARKAIVAGVCLRDLRPRFPPAAPPAWAALAEACWAGEPAARPGFDRVCAELLEWQRGALRG